MNRIILMLVSFLFISGCGPKYQLVNNPHVSPDTAVTLLIYRPDGFFHKHNPEEPFVYLNGEKIGTLGVGETIETQVSLGKNTISMRGNILSIPSSKIGTIELDVKDNNDHYVRYSYDFEYIAGTTAVGDSALQQVSENIGEARQ